MFSQVAHLRGEVLCELKFIWAPLRVSMAKYLESMRHHMNDKVWKNELKLRTVGNSIALHYKTSYWATRPCVLIVASTALVQRKKGGRDLSESLVNTWAWLYLLNFSWYTSAYFMLTNPQFMKKVHSLTRLEPPETVWQRHSWYYTGIKLYWNDALIHRYDVWEPVSDNEPPPNESVHPVSQLYCKIRSSQTNCKLVTFSQKKCPSYYKKSN